MKLTLYLDPSGRYRAGCELDELPRSGVPHPDTLARLCATAARLMADAVAAAERGGSKPKDDDEEDPKRLDSQLSDPAAEHAPDIATERPRFGGPMPVGKALLQWARERDQEDDLKEFGRQRKYPSLVKTWSHDMCTDATLYLEAIRSGGSYRPHSQAVHPRSPATERTR